MEMTMQKIAWLLLMATLAISGVTLSGPARAQSALTDGLVTKIDVSANKITIKHGPMKKFGMDDGMTMVYAVKDPAILGAVKSGDKVKFDADDVNGQFVVTKIEKAK
jgi:Cu/Ag efflux protein CusF